MGRSGEKVEPFTTQRAKRRSATFSSPPGGGIGALPITHDEAAPPAAAHELMTVPEVARLLRTNPKALLGVRDVMERLGVQPGHGASAYCGWDDSGGPDQGIAQVSTGRRGRSGAGRRRGTGSRPVTPRACLRVTPTGIEPVT